MSQFLPGFQAQAETNFSVQLNTHTTPKKRFCQENKRSYRGLRKSDTHGKVDPTNTLIIFRTGKVSVNFYIGISSPTNCIRQTSSPKTGESSDKTRTVLQGIFPNTKSHPQAKKGIIQKPCQYRWSQAEIRCLNGLVQGQTHTTVSQCKQWLSNGLFPYPGRTARSLYQAAIRQKFSRRTTETENPLLRPLAKASERFQTPEERDSPRANKEPIPSSRRSFFDVVLNPIIESDSTKES